jgi:hypothetical protein
MILTAAFLLFALFGALFLVLLPAPLAEEMGKEQTTQAPTAQKAAGN